MSKKITLLINNIITPYDIARANQIDKVLNKKFEVWFQSSGDINRHWSDFPTINFSYKILTDFPLRLVGADVHTFHFNLQIMRLLNQKKNKIGRVVICGWDSFTYMYTAFFCVRNKIPYTLWSGSTQYEHNWKRQLFLPIIKLIIKHANNYIAYGTRARALLILLGASANKVKIFINNVDVQYFIKKAKINHSQRQILLEKYQLPRNHFLFMYVGQLINRKGITELIHAFSNAFSAQQPVSLLIVGTGPLKEFVQRLIKNHSIYYIPHQEYHQMPELYACANCLVLPSHQEVWGLVVNEAMASNIPVIVTKQAGVAPDLVDHGKTGYIYQAGDIRTLSILLRKMILNSQKMIPNLRKIIMTTDSKVQAQKVFQKL